ncbi:hypothetical protein BDF20DRAFT_832804 [Mycotypha africana]|uniref:uncharacterized protein n=1 Tax=Mycotypha africana TaxID=64632 RepID=UPI002301B1ED|nr:uncharacterized protein BDF20DRAFT_832804 [Mycotypha africana]KAI8987920.1 hypothetical protein BDF20DRAFT_832804 [Mycotypha africana]
MTSIVAAYSPIDQADALAKKPKPLLKLFRKNKPEPLIHPQQYHQLGSGSSAVIPANSMLNDTHFNPYSHSTHASIVPLPLNTTAPNNTHHILRKAPLPPQHYYPSSNNEQPRLAKRQVNQHGKSSSRSANRGRSKSVNRDPNCSTTRLLEEREQALNKLCGNSPLTSLTDSLPLLSPSYSSSSSGSSKSKPFKPAFSASASTNQRNAQVPSVPRLGMSSNNNGHSNGIRKFASAHDLRKATRLQQDELRRRAQEEPLPSISHKFNISSEKARLERTSAKKFKKNNGGTYNDDNIPIGFLKPSSASQESTPSSPFNGILNKEKEVGLDDRDFHKAVADKYKEKVKEQLQTRHIENDDDDIPISFLTLKHSISINN